MKKLLVLLIFIFCLLALKGYAQDRWVYVAESNDCILYYDSETIKYNNNSVTVYIKTVYKSDESIKTGIDHQISKNIIYCGEYNFETVSITTYYNNGTNEGVNLNKYRNIVPETVMEEVYKRLCR